MVGRWSPRRLRSFPTFPTPASSVYAGYLGGHETQVLARLASHVRRQLYQLPAAGSQEQQLDSLHGRALDIRNRQVLKPCSETRPTGIVLIAVRCFSFKQEEHYERITLVDYCWFDCRFSCGQSDEGWRLWCGRRYHSRNAGSCSRWLDFRASGDRNRRRADWVDSGGICGRGDTYLDHALAEKGVECGDKKSMRRGRASVAAQFFCDTVFLVGRSLRGQEPLRGIGTKIFPARAIHFGLRFVT